MNDDLTVLGPDGIRRTYGEHFDTVMDVEQDPTGAMWAIQKQSARIEELEAKLAKAVEALEWCATADHNIIARSTLAELKGG